MKLPIVLAIVVLAVTLLGCQSNSSSSAQADAKQITLYKSLSEGSEDAKVIIVEFSDFQCPFCGKYVNQTYYLIKQNYIDTGKVRYYFKDFPLSFHENARPAANAARCAAEQGKFFAYHDILFKNQNSLTADNFKKWAASLGLDDAKFNNCISNKTYDRFISVDIAEGTSAGITGTPFFLINGKAITGAYPYATFKEAIDSALSLS
jgi:protein-disulfide isomerase